MRPLTRRTLMHGTAGAAASLLSARSLLAQESPGNLADVQEFHQAAIEDPNPYDPHLSHNLGSKGQITFRMWASVVKLDENLQVAPDIATSWDVSDDATTYTFHLDPERTFSDGSPITAEDVAWSWIRSLNPATENIVAGIYLGDIVGATEFWLGETTEPPPGIQVLDDHTLEVTLKAPANYYPEILVNSSSCVIKQSDVEAGTPEQPWFTTAKAFSGPYVIESYTPQASLTLTRNPHYPIAHTIERLSYTYVDNAQTQFLLYQNGEVDFTELEVADADHVKNDDPTYREELIEQPLWLFRPLYLRTQIAPFDDEQVRRAFAMAIDKEALLGTVLRGLDRDIKGIYYPELNTYTEQVPEIVFDPAAAQAELAASSYGSAANLPPLRFWLSSGPQETEARVAAALQEMWLQNLGVENMEIRLVNSGSEVRASDAQITIGGEGLHYPHAYGAVRYLTCVAQNNTAQHCDPEWDAMVEQAASTPDEEESIRLFQEAQNDVLEQVAIVPLYQSVAYFLIKPYIKNLKTSAMYIFPDFDQVYIEQH